MQIRSTRRGAATARRHDLAGGPRVAFLHDGAAQKVDFVLSVDRKQWAIDINASRQVDAPDLKGLGAFAECAQKVTRWTVVFVATASATR
jgi:hypothetical protein